MCWRPEIESLNCIALPRCLHSPEPSSLLQDVKFGAANLPAMNFMGGGATNGQEWLDFLGTVKDKRVPPVGSPFQLNFNPGGNSTPVPPEITPAQEKLPTCGDPLFMCSCADCPPAPGCQAVREAGAAGLWVTHGVGPGRKKSSCAQG